MEKVKIILRMPNWLGDLVMATAALQALREQFPFSQLTVMCKKQFFPLLKNNKNINRFFLFEKPKSFFCRDQKEIIHRIKEERFDLGILFTNSFSSAYYFWKGKVKRRLGYKSHFRSFLLNMRVPFPKEKIKIHQVDIYKALLRPLKIEKSNLIPQIDISDEDVFQARDLLEKEGYLTGKKLVGINPCAAYGPAKCWPLSRYLQLAKNLLQDKELFVVFTGEKSIFSSSDELLEIEKVELPSRAIDLTGKTDLMLLSGVIKLCDLYVSNDSGPMHMAAALNVPIVAIFGSTSDLMTGPYGSGEVIHKRVSCYPCFKRVCNKDFSCMKNIEVQEVESRVKVKLYA